MEKAQPARQAPPASAVHYPPLPVDEMPLQRAQKRLVTQSERDEVASLPPQQAADSPLATERSVEGQ